MKHIEGMIPFITKDEIKELTKKLAEDIQRDYLGKKISVVCPLMGSAFFCADLIREIKNPLQLDFVSISSPRGKAVRINKDVSIDLRGQHVLIVEEVIDAGRSLSFLRDRILMAGPASLNIVTLLDKPSRREHPIVADYIGKTIDDRFMIGYGLDSDQIGRNYADIYNYTQ